jgi:hypothetical protein
MLSIAFLLKAAVVQEVTLHRLWAPNRIVLRAGSAVAGTAAAKTNKFHTRVLAKSKRKIMKMAVARQLLSGVEYGSGAEKNSISF